MEELANNIRRLLGLHAMRATKDSRLIEGLSPQALSELQSNTRRPSLATAQKLAKFFEIPLERLLEAPFVDLLSHELADASRFKRVERKKAGAPSPKSVRRAKST
jgi:transcriptional regulator with XRE-family HTH domain